MVRQTGVLGAVVIGSDFRALGVVRSLGRRGIPCIVIDNVQRAAWFSRYAVKRYKWHGPMDNTHFVNYLLHVGKEQRLENWLLFPTTDDVVELVAHNRQQLALVYRLITPSWEVVRWANDKRLTYRMAQELGIAYPETWYASGERDLRAGQISFPAIIKPARSVHFHRSMHLKAFPVNNYEELSAQYSRAAKIICPDELMIQQMIPGDGNTQFSVGVFCKEGNVLFWMSARRTRQYPIDYGLNSSFVEAVELPELLEPVKNLMQYMHFSGIAEIEFKYDSRDQQYKLLDINVRAWGWHTLCRICGLDFPYIQYCDALGLELEASTPRYHHHWVRLLTDIPAGWQEIRAGITTPSDYLRSLIGPTAFSVFAWEDPLPALGIVPLLCSQE
ncbi:ATP-grasp domain-containing protein [Ktedonosporobacter rubrisoli]|uniref:ATP-grasp domain-containing protein n=1 Tax=Ktedonosporobacter rubrisoli TaxID=2509675 RepID=A0A4P6K591_KTERU|nr:ATP-grasp domain-containing protein [Ktedonosporobacter rubrisoli]QBD83255.1 ATP-grasp domain-containing protein [Ktedonosporobacter rubrisoli]